MATKIQSNTQSAITDWSHFVSVKISGMKAGYIMTFDTRDDSVTEYRIASEVQSDKKGRSYYLAFVESRSEPVGIMYLTHSTFEQYQSAKTRGVVTFGGGRTWNDYI